MKKIALFVLAILSSLGCLAGDSVEVWFQNVAVPQGGAAEMVVRWDNQADNLLYHRGDGYHGCIMGTGNLIHIRNGKKLVVK